MNKPNNLETIKALTKCIDLISETLFLLQDKRVTLEEKMIRDHLHELAAKLSLALGSIHLYFKANNYDIDSQMMSELNDLCLEIQEEVGELLKIVKYNWNFLEQYFEYNFLAKLKNECKFVERLEKITASIENKN